MKLKTFIKLNNAIKTEYTVLRNDDIVDSFYYNYLEENHDTIIKQYKTREKYINMGAEVVRFSAWESMMLVTLDITNCKEVI